jgi:dienelactone hydrolase
MRRKTVVRTALLLIAMALIVFGRRYVTGAAFVVQAAGLDGVARRIASWDSVEVTEHDVTIPWRGGSLRGRRYEPARATARAVLLVPGIHAAGIDEPRLIGFAHDFAATGHPVVTAQLDDLAHYQISPRTTDMIEDAGRWLADAEQSARDGRIGMMGISFGGGLTLVAAGRPTLRDRVAFTMSFGGHGDLPRTLKFLCTGIQADGTLRPPHDYGVAIVLLTAAPLVVPADQVQPLRDSILSFLEASRLDMVDKAKARGEFEHARALEQGLPEPAKALMGYVNARDVAHLGPILLPHVAAFGADAALSPDRAAPPACPVYLIHGSEDNVIPAAESVVLARDLRARGVTVHQLTTPLITHAEVDRAPTAKAIWRLIDFWADLLSE